MPKKFRSLLVLAVIGACLAVPASSQATLVFTRNPFSPTVHVANDNGSSARKVGSGSNPRVSPDGQTIVFYRLGKGNQSADLMVAPAAGGAPKKLMSNWQDPFVFAWSSDSSSGWSQSISPVDSSTRSTRGISLEPALPPEAASSWSTPKRRTKTSRRAVTSTGSTSFPLGPSAWLPKNRSG